MGDFLYFYIYVSFDYIVVFCNYLARVGRWVIFCIIFLYFCILQLLSQGGAVGDGQKGDSKVFCRLRRENLIQSRFILFFMISCWLWYLHGLILYTNIHVIYLINRAY